MELWQEIRQRRQHLQLSGRQVALQAGIKVKHYYDIENGRHPYPRNDTVNRIAKVLGVRVVVALVADNEEQT